MCRAISTAQPDFQLFFETRKTGEPCWHIESQRFGFAGEGVANSVLIVDDNAAVRHALCALFTSTEFYVCSEAVNGQEGIEKALALRPELIVLDLSMPVMNGLQAAAKIRELLPDTPIILFSEYSDVLSPQDAQAAGLSAVISKAEHTSVLLGKARALVHHCAA